MPTPTGSETVGERLTRLRAELARVRETIARAETSGGARTFGGVAVTEIAYDRALRRSRELELDIRKLEARATGARSSAARQIQARGED